MKLWDKLMGRGDGLTPPDIGQEEAAEAELAKKQKKIIKEAVAMPKKPIAKKPAPIVTPVPVVDDEDEVEQIENDEAVPVKKKIKSAVNSTMAFEKSKLEMQKVSVQIESLKALINGYGERISLLSQQIGEVRAMNINNEKAVGKLGLGAAKAIEIVQSVQPDKLRIDYQRAEMKVQQLDEKIESNKQFMDLIMKELKEIRGKMNGFVGSEGLLKLNEDIKTDLIQTQQMAAKTKMQADKTEQLFVEMRRNLAETQKVNAQINNLDANYSGIHKEVTGLKIDFSNIVKRPDLESFKKEIEAKVTLVTTGLSNIDIIKEENVRLSRLIETILGVVQENKQDIEAVALAVGDDNLQAVETYAVKINSILSVLDIFAEKMIKIEKKLGIKSKGKRGKIILDELEAEPVVDNAEPANVELGAEPVNVGVEVETVNAKPLFGRSYQGKGSEESDETSEPIARHKTKVKSKSGKVRKRLIKKRPDKLEKVREELKAIRKLNNVSLKKKVVKVKKKGKVKKAKSKKVVKVKK